MLCFLDLEWKNWIAVNNRFELFNKDCIRTEHESNLKMDPKRTRGFKRCKF